MSDFPTQLLVAAGTTFEFRSDLYAVTCAPDRVPDAALAVVNDDARTAIAICRGNPHSHGGSAPVYSSSSDGPLAVPTGRVFVRLARNMAPSTRRAKFEAAGFVVDQLLSYAPNAAWLRPVRGGISHALAPTALQELRAIAGVEHVEPQLLMSREFKQ